VNAERDHLRGQLYRVGVAGDPRHQEQDAVPTACGRCACYEIATQDGLSSGTLYIDDGGLTADGDRFFEGADLQVCVYCGRSGSRQLDAVTFEGAEPREGKRDSIGTGPQVDDLVLTGVVGDDRPHLLDECGTGCLDRYARQHGTRRISDDSSK
jgi:hypothetical protein